MGRFFLLCIISFLAFASWTSADPCQFEVNGVVYDLSALRNDKQDYKQSVIGMGKNVYVSINVCRPVLTSSCGTDSGACQEWCVRETIPSVSNRLRDSAKGHASFGRASTVTAELLDSTDYNLENPQGLTLQYQGGDGIRSYQVDFVCADQGGVRTGASVGG